MRLVRGTGPRGLAVLPPRSSDLIRPAIFARRRDVLAHLARHEIAFAEDPSNADVRFVRVRVRREIMPLLETLSPRVVEALTGLADAMVELDLEPDGPSLGRGQRAQIATAALRGKPKIALRVEGGLELVVPLDLRAKKR
jgi:tRNA(Ile)-lysidine synthase